MRIVPFVTVLFLPVQTAIFDILCAEISCSCVETHISHKKYFHFS